MWRLLHWFWVVELGLAIVISLPVAAWCILLVYHGKIHGLFGLFLWFGIFLYAARRIKLRRRWARLRSLREHQRRQA